MKQNEVTPNEIMPNEGEDGDELVIQKVPLELFVPSEYNSRWYRPPDHVQKLVKSLRVHGQREALRVYPGIGDDLGKYMVVSGVTRLIAAKALGWKTLDAIVDPAMDPNDPLTLISLSRQYNEVSQETDMDRATLLARLEDKGYSQDEIVMAMGLKSSRKLFKLRLFRELPPSILAIAAQYPNKISAEFAEILEGAVAELGEEKALILAEEVVAKNLSKEDLKMRIRAECRKIANIPQRGTKEKETVFRFGDAKGGNLRIVRNSSSGEREVQLKIHFPDDDDNDTLFAEIESMVRVIKEKRRRAKK